MRAKSNGDPPDPDPDLDIDPATRRELEDRIAEISRENALLEKVAPTNFLIRVPARADRPSLSI